MRTGNGQISRLLCVLMLVAVSACETATFDPPSSAIRQQMGKVAVSALPYHVFAKLEEPSKGAGEGAASGAGQGALLGGLGPVYGFCGTGDGFACLFGIALGAVLVIPSAAIGGVVGAVRAHPEGEVLSASKSLQEAIRSAQISESVKRHLLLMSIGFGLKPLPPAPLPARHVQQPHPFPDAVSAPLSDAGAISKPLEVPDPDDPQGEAPDGQWAPPEPEPLPAAPGFDTLLEISTRSFELAVSGKIEPDIAPKIAVQARIIRSRDRRELYRRSWLYWGPERDFFEASAANAALFRDDLELAYRALASRIRDDLFVSLEAETQRPPQEGKIVTLAALEAPPAVVGMPGQFLSPGNVVQEGRSAIAWNDPNRAKDAGEGPCNGSCDGAWLLTVRIDEFLEDGIEKTVSVEGGRFETRLERGSRTWVTLKGNIDEKGQLKGSGAFETRMAGWPQQRTFRVETGFDGQAFQARGNMRGHNALESYELELRRGL
jgi:hypothetical protein